MQRLKLTALVALLLFALPIVTVFGGGYPIGDPILGTTGAPALASPSLYAGVLNVLYADGAPVVLASNHITLELCATTNATNATTTTTTTTYSNTNVTTGCVTVASNLKQTAPGTYTYTFTPPSLSGIITIYVTAGDLADDNGRIFPSVDTSIGTYASTSSGTPSSSTANPVPTQTPAQSPTGAQPPESSQLTNKAVSTTEPMQQSPILPVVLSLIVLLVAAVGLAVYPARVT